MLLYYTSFWEIDAYWEHNGLAGPVYDENHMIFFQIRHGNLLCIRGLKKSSLKLKIGIIYR